MRVHACATLVVACAFLQQFPVVESRQMDVDAVVPEDTPVPLGPTGLVQEERHDSVKEEEAKESKSSSATDRLLKTLERDRKEFAAKNHVKVKLKKKMVKKAPRSAADVARAQKDFQKTSKTLTNNIIKTLERHRKEYKSKLAVKAEQSTDADDKKVEKSKKVQAKKREAAQKKEKLAALIKEKSTKAAKKKHMAALKKEKHEKLAGKTEKAKKWKAHEAGKKKREHKKRELARKSAEIVAKGPHTVIERVGSAWAPGTVGKLMNEYDHEWLPSEVSGYEKQVINNIMAKPDGSAKYFIPDLQHWYPSKRVSKQKLADLNSWISPTALGSAEPSSSYPHNCKMFCTSPEGEKYCCQPVGDPEPVFPGMALPKDDPIPVKEPTPAAFQKSTKASLAKATKQIAALAAKVKADAPKKVVKGFSDAIKSVKSLADRALKGSAKDAASSFAKSIRKVKEQAKTDAAKSGS